MRQRSILHSLSPYLLDPGAYNNCWIWTEPFYVANGSDKAYCYTKKPDIPDNSWEDWMDEEDGFDEELERYMEEQDATRGPKPTQSLNDFDDEY